MHREYTFIVCLALRADRMEVSRLHSLSVRGLSTLPQRMIATRSEDAIFPRHRAGTITKEVSAFGSIDRLGHSPDLLFTPMTIEKLSSTLTKVPTGLRTVLAPATTRMARLNKDWLATDLALAFNHMLTIQNYAQMLKHSFVHKPIH